ncbi:MAG: hypothetical protein IME93_02555 [Proteobacteria bacterium]|nr:hypothetical protein [Pseudomonadota bacterium]
MAQFLRLTVGESSFLLPGSASLGIEKKDKLLINSAGSNVIGWKQDGNNKWPAYAIDNMWNIDPTAPWDRVVYIPASPFPVGIGADSIEMLSDTDIEPAPFTPVGEAPSRYGHLFGAAWVDSDKTYLVINPSGVAGYLLTIGGSA